MEKQSFPKDWDEARVRKVIEYHETQTEEEELAEYEAAFRDPALTRMFVPTALVPAIARLIAKHDEKSSNGRARTRRASKSRTKKPRKATA